jgi:farnesyl-diphosphate farnesyltransferase
MTGPANELLKATARSFYLTLRVLPAAVRSQIGLAYLLARTTDTVADTEIIPLARRLDALRALRERILGESTAPLDFNEFTPHQGSPAERLLLEQVGNSVAALQNLSAADRELVRSVLVTITSGQELDIQRFAAAAPGNPVALGTAADLEDYTYRVAGCVGEFWSKLCRAHLFPRANLDETAWLADGVRFGKGLQMVNILRDLPADLKNGRCYLPLEDLSPAGFTPENLLLPDREAKFLSLYRVYLDQAQAHLTAGWRYTNSLPFNQFRVRLACVWPILIGIRSLERLRGARVRDLQARVKVSRAQVYGLMVKSTLASPIPSLWRRLL